MMYACNGIKYHTFIVAVMTVRFCKPSGACVRTQNYKVV